MYLPINKLAGKPVPKSLKKSKTDRNNTKKTTLDGKSIQNK